MAVVYEAIFLDVKGSAHAAQVILSPVTISILYTDESGTRREVYWLAREVVSMEQRGEEAILVYRNRSNEIENLVTRDKPLIDEIKRNYRSSRFSGGRRNFFTTVVGRLFMFLSFVIGFIALIYFLLLPWLAERIANNVSKEWEVSVGEKIYSSLERGFKVDSAKTRLINQFYKATGYSIEYPVYITVVNEKVLNAFALPGGRIVVYDEILEKMRQPSELAALLAHEASHVSKRHSLRNMTRNLARGMFLMILLGNDSGIGAVLVDNANTLKQLEYSRKLETEADENGMDLMRKGNIDPSGMLELIRLLKSNSTGEEQSTLLSTHPEFNDRIGNIQRNLKMKPAVGSHHQALQTIFNELKQDY